MPDEMVVVIENLKKTYKTGVVRGRARTVLDGITFSIPRGEVFGYLGPNGSGKTTTLKIIMGLVAPSEGRVSVLGSSDADRAWRSKAGFLPEHPYFYDYLTAAEYLDYAGRLFGLTRARRRERARFLLNLVGLESAADVSIRRYSKGMVQRLGLAQALVNDPKIAFLDEPMSGLDPVGRHLVKNIILDLKRQGCTVFFSTHILPDAETLCDRIGLLNRGKLTAIGRLDEILSIDVAHMEVVMSGVDVDALGDDARAVVHTAHRMGERLRLHVGEADLGRVVFAIERAQGRVLSVQPVRQSLEEFFCREAGKERSGDTWPVEA